MTDTSHGKHYPRTHTYTCANFILPYVDDVRVPLCERASGKCPWDIRDDRKGGLKWNKFPFSVKASGLNGGPKSLAGGYLLAFSF